VPASPQAAVGSARRRSAGQRGHAELRWNGTSRIPHRCNGTAHDVLVRLPRPAAADLKDHRPLRPQRPARLRRSRPPDLDHRRHRAGLERYLQQGRVRVEFPAEIYSTAQRRSQLSGQFATLAEGSIGAITETSDIADIYLGTGQQVASYNKLNQTAYVSDSILRYAANGICCLTDSGPMHGMPRTGWLASPILVSPASRPLSPMTELAGASPSAARQQAAPPQQRRMSGATRASARHEMPGVPRHAPTTTTASLFRERPHRATTMALISLARCVAPLRALA
jgi:hypothetical protein